LIRNKDSAGPIVHTGAAAGTQTDTKEITNTKLLNLSTRKSVKINENKNLKKNRIIGDDDDIFSTQNQLLSIALKVCNIEEENKATQRAVALLKQRFDEIITYRKDEKARNRERRFY
jgi:hypothetical protein